MIRVERATPADFESVLPLLESFNNPAITRAQWRSLFHLPWPCDDDLRGFLLRDGEKTVGFFGVIPSVRAGERFANLTSWVTPPEVRNSSLLLLKEVLALRDRTITCMTPAPQLVPLYRRAGFAELETRLRIAYPLPCGGLPRYRTTMDAQHIERLVRGEAAQVFADHRTLPCRMLLIHRGDEQCLVISTRTKGRRWHFAHIHYASEAGVFARAFDLVKLRLCLAHRAVFCRMDARLADKFAVRWDREAQLANPHFFRSPRLAAAQIDSLYSELLMLPL
jgi:hypothetical protein